MGDYCMLGQHFMLRLPTMASPNDEPGSITRLSQDLQCSDTGVREEAAARLWQRYSPYLRRLAWRHLTPELRRRVDEDDVSQEAFFEFCRGRQEQQNTLANRDQLWRLLATIAIRKCDNAAAFHGAAKRDFRREKPIERDDGGHSRSYLDLLTGAALDPQAMAAFHEQYENLLLRLAEKHRNVVTARLAGYTIEEIGSMVGRVKRTVERWMEDVKQQLIEEFGHEPDGLK